MATRQARAVHSRALIALEGQVSKKKRSYSSRMLCRLCGWLRERAMGAAVWCCSILHLGRIVWSSYLETTRFHRRHHLTGTHRFSLFIPSALSRELSPMRELTFRLFLLSKAGFYDWGSGFLCKLPLCSASSSLGWAGAFVLTWCVGALVHRGALYMILSTFILQDFKPSYFNSFDFSLEFDGVAVTPMAEAEEIL